MGSYTKKQVEDMVAAAREQGREEVLEARKYAGLMPDVAPLRKAQDMRREIEEAARVSQDKADIVARGYLLDEYGRGYATMSGHRTCPCCFVEPCRPRCACSTPSSSTPCVRCCRYGSVEQRVAVARYIVGREKTSGKKDVVRDALKSLVVAVDEYISERDNPAPDYAHRHSLRERLKKVLAETRGYVEEP
jgi:hypothetical protein